MRVLRRLMVDPSRVPIDLQTPSVASRVDTAGRLVPDAVVHDGGSGGEADEKDDEGFQGDYDAAAGRPGVPSRD
jgi:hypothetical protein